MVHDRPIEERREVRLQKAIAEAGFCSRRKAEELIQKGLVRVNGEIAKIGMNVDASKDRILVNGQVLQPEAKVHLLLNKPRGYITTSDDPWGRRNVVSLIHEPVRVFPVGRLDKDTSGLLIMTNDGEFANRILHPRYQVDRTYEATLDRRVSDEDIKLMNGGISLDRVWIDIRAQKTSPKTVRITVATGLNKEIKRIFKRFGYWVEALRRTGIGGIQLHRLKEGSYRHLTEKEIEMLTTEKTVTRPSAGRNRTGAARRAPVARR